MANEISSSPNAQPNTPPNDQPDVHTDHKHQRAHPHGPSRKVDPADYAHIPGWGADLDEKDRPAYPKERMPQRLEVPWDEPAQQVAKVKILHSTERPGITPVFGTPNPPSGLSGKIREVSFKYSENDIRHWLMLMFADRVNMVEGIGYDLARGHIPNILGEMGIQAEWKYNRPALIRKAVTVSAIVAVGLLLASRRKHTRRR